MKKAYRSGALFIIPPESGLLTVVIITLTCFFVLLSSVWVHYFGLTSCLGAFQKAYDSFEFLAG